MKFGLIEALGGIRWIKGSHYAGIIAPATEPATSFNLILPAALPGSSQAVFVDASGQISFGSVSGGAVNFSAPSEFSVSGSGTDTIALSWASQTTNKFLASPNGSTGTPTFRAIAYADISALVGTGSSTIAAGNDSRFHTQATDTGTTAISFQINSGASGPRLKDASGELQARNAGDTAFADFRANNVTIAGNLTVSGTTFTVNSETMTIDDNIIVLNNNVSSGTPTEDGGVQVRRGASTSASLLWDETNDLWKAGLAGSEVGLSRYYETTFTNASLTSGVLTVTHSLGRDTVPVTVKDNNGKTVMPDEITFSSTSALTIDLTSFGTLSGTWKVEVG